MSLRGPSGPWQSPSLEDCRGRALCQPGIDTPPYVGREYIPAGHHPCLSIWIDAESNKNHCHCAGRRPVAIRTADTQGTDGIGPLWEEAVKNLFDF